MKYVIKPGVFLTKICGEYFLISGKEARENCPYVTQLNETAGYIWEKLVLGMSDIEILQSVHDEYDTENTEETSKAVKAFIYQLKEAGFIIEKSEE